MKVVVTGAMGFVGTHLSRALLQNGHQVIGVDVAAPENPSEHPDLAYIAADTTQKGKWQDMVGAADAVVNLAGKNIFTYWTKSVKEQIYNSRILTAGRVAEALSKDQILISTSAAGYYGDRENEVMDETKPPGEGFLARVCKDWEKEALKGENKGARTVITRFGVVLHHSGGALTMMRPFFRAFLGAKLGSGGQWFPWVHLEDLIRGVEFSIADKTLSGPVNLCAPAPATNQEFTTALGHALNRPTPFRAPAFAMKLFLREFGRSLLMSQKAVPAKLTEHGFTFKHPDIQTALEDIASYW